jgi:hypothetical protein
MRDRARELGETGEQDRAASRLREVMTWGSAVTKSMHSVGRLETVRIPPVLGRFANATLRDGRGLRGVCMLRAFVVRSGGAVTSNFDLLVAAVDDAPVDFPEKLAAALQAAQHQHQLYRRWTLLPCRCA